MALALGLVGCPSKPASPPAEASAVSASTGSRAPSGSTANSPSRAPSGTASGAEALISKPLGDGFVLVDDSNTLESQSPFVGVIVPAERGRSFYIGDHGKAEGYFTPTVVQALVVANALRERSWSEHPGIGKRLHQYRYHIVGVERAGKQMLFLNAFCDAAGDWYRQPLGVDDGGDCYFQLSFDPTTKTVVRLTVNGEG